MAPNKLTSVRVHLFQFGDAAPDKSSAVLLCVQGFRSIKEPQAIGPAFIKCTMGKKVFQFKIPESVRPKRQLQSFTFDNARAAVVVCNVTKSTSLDKAKTWVEELQRAYPRIIIALIATKLDLVFQGSGSSTSGLLNADEEAEQQATKEKVAAYAKDAGLLFFETAATHAGGVVDAFKQFSSTMLLVHVLPSANGTTHDTSGPFGALNGDTGSTPYSSNDLRVNLSKTEEVAGSETGETNERGSEGHFKDSESGGINAGRSTVTSPAPIFWPSVRVLPTGSWTPLATSSIATSSIATSPKLEVASLEADRKLKQAEIEEEKRPFKVDAWGKAQAAFEERERETAAANESARIQAASEEEEALAKREGKLPQRNVHFSLSHSQSPAPVSQVWRRTGGVGAATYTLATPPWFSVNSSNSIRPKDTTQALPSSSTTTRKELDGGPSLLAGLATQRAGSWRERAVKAAEAQKTSQNDEKVGQAEPVSEIPLSFDNSPELSTPTQTSTNEASQANMTEAELNSLRGPVSEEEVDNLAGQCNRTSTNSNDDRYFTLLDLKQPPPDFEVSLVRRPLNENDLVALQGPEPTPPSEIVAMIPFECAENALAYCLKTVSELLATLPPPKPDELERRRAALAAINNIALNLREERVPRE